MRLVKTSNNSLIFYNFSGEPKACDGECPCVVPSIPEMAPAPAYESNGRSVEPSNQPLSTCECLPGDIDPVCTKSGETLWYGCEAICLYVS